MNIPSNLPLFANISPNDLPNLLYCIRAAVKTYEKGATIIPQDETVKDFGILLSGQARSLKRDADGRQVIVTIINPGGVVGIMLAATPDEPSPVAVVAVEECTLLRIPFAHIAHVCDCGKCNGRIQLLRNYTTLLAYKALELHERIDCLLETTVRDKVLRYLHRVAAEKDSKHFTIPLDRVAMAEYLNVDRSALSRELSRMKSDGLIEYNRNEFRLKVASR